MILREKYESECNGIIRSSSKRGSLPTAVKIAIEIYQNREVDPNHIDSVVNCQHITENKKCAVSIDDTVDDKPIGAGDCKNYIYFNEIMKGAFTLDDYNNRPKPCPEEECTGLVLPTVNANIGECYKCRTKIGWHRFSTK